MTASPSFPAMLTALRASWCAGTSSWGVDWPAGNPSRGQCVASALVVQDYYGGGLVRFVVHDSGSPEHHYVNRLPGGALFDTTSPQYSILAEFRPHPVPLGDYPDVRSYLLADADIRGQYDLLRRRVAAAMPGSTPPCPA